MLCLVVLVQLITIGHSAAASLSEELWSNLQSIRALTGSTSAASLIQNLTSGTTDGQNPEHTSDNQSFVNMLKREIKSLSSQLKRAEEDLLHSSAAATNASHVSVHSKQANESVGTALLFRGHEMRGRSSAARRDPTKPEGRTYFPMEPIGVLSSHVGGKNTDKVEGECSPGDDWWGRRLLEEKGFYMASCENMGWRTVATWCECKVAVEHLKITEGRVYEVGQSCDSPAGCPNEPAGCYVKDDVVYFNPLHVVNVLSCAKWTDWEKQKGNRGCICMGNPTTTTTTTLQPCTDFSGYYKNKAQETVAVQQYQDCGLKVTTQGTTWKNWTAWKGGWHIVDPNASKTVTGTADHDSIVVDGTIGRGLDHFSNPNGTRPNGDTNLNYPWGKALLQFDDDDVWTRMACNIFNGTYFSDGPEDTPLKWVVIQSGCLANITGGDLGVIKTGEGKGDSNFKTGKVVGNFLFWKNKKGNLDEELLTVKWDDGSKDWTRDQSALALHSGKTVPSPE